MNKVIRKGEVAVLYSPSYGSGWYTWNTEVKECVFSPEIVQLIEENRQDEITDEYCKKLFGVEYFYSGGVMDLEIQWVKQGTVFEITEYDGYESIDIINEKEYFTA